MTSYYWTFGSKEEKGFVAVTVAYPPTLRVAHGSLEVDISRLPKKSLNTMCSKTEKLKGIKGSSLLRSSDGGDP